MATGTALTPEEIRDLVARLLPSTRVKLEKNVPRYRDWYWRILVSDDADYCMLKIDNESRPDSLTVRGSRNYFVRTSGLRLEPRHAEQQIMELIEGEKNRLRNAIKFMF